MKKLVLVLMLAFLLFNISCKKDRNCTCSVPNGESVNIGKVNSTKEKADKKCEDKGRAYFEAEGGEAIPDAEWELYKAFGFSCRSDKDGKIINENYNKFSEAEIAKQDSLRAEEIAKEVGEAEGLNE